MSIQIDQGVLTVATKRGLRPTAIPDITARARSIFKLVNGVPTAFEPDGKAVRCGKDGLTPMTLEEWIKCPKLLVCSNRTWAAVPPATAPVGSAVGRKYAIERTAELVQFGQCGIVESAPEFDAIAAEGGREVKMPFWKDLTATRQLLSDSASLTVNKIRSDQDIARIHNDAQVWSVNHLAKVISVDDPMQAIVDLVSHLPVHPKAPAVGQGQVY